MAERSEDERYELDEALALVSDEHSFVAFLKLMAAKFETFQKRERQAASSSSSYGPGQLGWENVTIGTFLESAAAWAEDSAGEAPAQSGNNPWRTCAEILLRGKSYE